MIKDINKYIDHTLLKATATEKDIEKLCMEAKLYNFKSVCVNPSHVRYAKSLLEGTDVLVCTVIGFPLGANTKATKCYETEEAISAGADEIDMVINIGKVKEQNYDYIQDEIYGVVLHSSGHTVKVIIETCYLTDEEKICVCEAATKAKANFVKTSTGFGPGGALSEDVSLMKKHISENMEVKASGGVRSYKDFEIMVKAGANRIGTSNGISIITDKDALEDY